MKILVVDDEPKIASFIAKDLVASGMQVDEANSYEGAISSLENNSYDILCVDIKLGSRSGVDLVRECRAQGFKGGIILLTAYNTTKTKVMGLDAGADDYLTKPFELDELKARLRSLHRRIDKSVNQTVIDFEDLRLDLSTRSVERSGKKISLSNREFLLLQYLMRNQGRVLSRGQIAENVWDLHFDSDSNLTDVYINMLRKKIDYPFDRRLIHTVVGAGYVLRAES
jgi:DNA-binding response OmpR family regulator